MSGKLSLLAGTAVLLAAAPALAQAPAATSVGEVVVTASRITRDGFSAPTPTTVVGQEVLQQRAISNIGDALNSVPAFRAAVTPSAGGIGNTGAFLADLRGLGPSRTLVLLDGSRLPQTLVPGVGASAGTTDLNIIPTVLIRSSEVVTGGASAAYGSDAVSGVINFILDERLQGVKGTLQYGQTRYSDAQNTFAGLAAGTAFADGRGHVVLGFEYNRDEGTGIYNTKRPWGRQAWNTNTFSTRPAGTPFNVLGPNGNYFGSGSSGGLILTPGGLQGLAFVAGANGATTTSVFNRGLGNLTTGLDFFTDAALAANTAAGIFHLNTQQLRPAQERYNLLGKATFNISDKLTVYITPLYSHVKTDGIILIRRDGVGAGPALTLAQDNAYLQQALTPAQRVLVPAAGISLGYSGNDWGPNEREIEKETVRIQTGLKGDLGGSWKWDAAYVYGQNTSKVAIKNNFNNVNFRNALDAVSVNGQIVCRSVAARAAGCVPVNILGRANVSPDVARYVLGTASGIGRTRLDDLSANIQGEPVSTWAGPISIGVGVNYRQESIKQNVDPLSQSASWLTAAGNTLARVKQNVKEVYGETIIPLGRNLPLAKTIDFNGAVRMTDYSTSGSVTTWKAGFTWEPTDGLLVRTTRSRDIRAPNLIELFTPQTQSLPLPADPRAGVARPTNNAGFVVGGNPNLTPEKSKTQTIGVSYEPSFISNLRVSADYYNIEIRDAIASTGTQGVINNCFIGGVYTGNSWCSLITFANGDTANGQITGAQGITANVAQFSTKGIDFQASYRQPLEDINSNLAGQVTLNLMATHVMSFKSTTDVSTLFPNGIDRAGQTGAAFGGPAGLPNWLFNVGMNYELAKFAVNGNVRFISKGHQNNGLFGPDQAGHNTALTTSISNNNVPAVTYLDLGFKYDLGTDQKREIFFNVNNAFDKDPPLPAPGTAYYDTMGRTYKGGIRFTF